MSRFLPLTLEVDWNRMVSKKPGGWKQRKRMRERERERERKRESEKGVTRRIEARSSWRGHRPASVGVVVDVAVVVIVVGFTGKDWIQASAIKSLVSFFLDEFGSVSATVSFRWTLLTKDSKVWNFFVSRGLNKIFDNSFESTNSLSYSSTRTFFEVGIISRSFQRLAAAISKWPHLCKR